MSRLILTCAFVALATYAILSPASFGSAAGTIVASFSASMNGGKQ